MADLGEPYPQFGDLKYAPGSKARDEFLRAEASRVYADLHRGMGVLAQSLPIGPIPSRIECGTCLGTGKLNDGTPVCWECDGVGSVTVAAACGFETNDGTPTDLSGGGVTGQERLDQIAREFPSLVPGREPPQPSVAALRFVTRAQRLSQESLRHLWVMCNVPEKGDLVDSLESDYEEALLEQAGGEPGQLEFMDRALHALEELEDLDGSR